MIVCCIHFCVTFDILFYLFVFSVFSFLPFVRLLHLFVYCFCLFIAFAGSLHLFVSSIHLFVCIGLFIALVCLLQDKLMIPSLNRRFFLESQWLIENHPDQTLLNALLRVYQFRVFSIRCLWLWSTTDKVYYRSHVKLHWADSKHKQAVHCSGWLDLEVYLGPALRHRFNWISVADK